jgi:hypothetical protein
MREICELRSDTNMFYRFRLCAIRVPHLDRAGVWKWQTSVLLYSIVVVFSKIG